MNHCSTPIDPAILADYWLATLSPAEDETVSEHLLACDGCGDRLRETIALAEGIRDLARRGDLRMVVSGKFLERAVEEGLHVRQYSVPSGDSIQCTVTAGDDLLIARLAADLGAVQRVDLAMCDASGAEQYRLRDIPVERDAGAVIYQESITFAKAAPTTTFNLRLLALDQRGGERLLGEFTFNHTRTLPGPGGFRNHA